MFFTDSGDLVKGFGDWKPDQSDLELSFLDQSGLIDLITWGGSVGDSASATPTGGISAVPAAGALVAPVVVVVLGCTTTGGGMIITGDCGGDVEEAGISSNTPGGGGA